MRNKGVTFKNVRKKRYSCVLPTYLTAMFWKLYNYKPYALQSNKKLIVIDWEHVYLKKQYQESSFVLQNVFCLFAENQETSWSTQKVSNVKLMLQVKRTNKIESWWKISNSQPQGCALALVFGSRQFIFGNKGKESFSWRHRYLTAFWAPPIFFFLIIVFR